MDFHMKCIRITGFDGPSGDLKKGILRGFSGDMAYKWIPDYRAAPSWILRLRLRSRVLSTVLKRYEAQLKHLQPLNNRSTGCENSLLFRLC